MRLDKMCAPRNSGFKMMPNEVGTWKVGDKAFEFKGTTGFTITVDMKSGDLAIYQPQGLHLTAGFLDCA